MNFIEFGPFCWLLMKHVSCCLIFDKSTWQLFYYNLQHHWVFDCPKEQNQKEAKNSKISHMEFAIGQIWFFWSMIGKLIIKWYGNMANIHVEKAKHCSAISFLEHMKTDSIYLLLLYPQLNQDLIRKWQSLAFSLLS